MNLVHGALVRAGRWAVMAASIVFLAGCSVGEAEPPPDIGEPATHAVLEEFVLHLQPSRGRAAIERLPRAGEGSLSPQGFGDLNLCQDGLPGTSNPTLCGYAAGTATVELATDPSSVTDTFVTGAVNGCPAGSFCADVTLGSFWPRSLSNVYVQLTAITDATGLPISGHSATNSDTAPASYNLSNSLGLWQYTATAATTAGVVGMTPNNSGTRRWVFANPDDADVYVKMRVLASTTYSTYNLGLSFRPFIDACAGGTQLTGGQSGKTTQMPFPFTFYGSTFNGFGGKPQQVSFSKVGVLTFGAVSGTNSGSNVQLPSSGSAPKPSVFAFWDDLDYGSGASSHGMCFKAIGAAPNRQFVVTWTGMNFGGTVSNANKPASLTFSAVLNEGTDQIDLAYGTMSGPTSLAKGASATVGAQNEAGLLAATGSTYNTPNYPSNASWSLVPVP